jgi:hypothetical protein
MLVLLARVIQLQVAPSPELQEQMRPRISSRAEPPIRGDVTDRRGRPLSVTRFGHRVVVDPVVLSTHAQPIDDTIVKLAVATNEDRDKIGTAILGAIAKNDTILAERAAAAEPAGLSRIITRLLGRPVGPGTVKQVIGVSKAYATRVGGGPFPSELKDDLGQKMRDIGGEYGATTGRPRRTGWLDMVALKYAVDVNGLSALAITKLDVLSHFDTIHICTGYMLDGERIDYVPMDAGDYDRCDPIWDTMPGWGVDLSGARTFDDLPPQARAYIERIEQMTGVAAYLVSVGPGRGETIVRRKLFEG